ncbi:MAG TPA: YihY/virulence factor BrkB family protein, partial [Planctomycetota bacterium]|nr:YihY/virulence factor BrkB family protein [Planctomycetota bacterium]
MSANFKSRLIDRFASAPSLGGRRARLYRWFSEEIWRLDETPRGVVASAGRRIGRLAFLTASGFYGDRCMVRASALTYTTVLSLVPLLAVCFSVLKGLGWYEEFRRKTLASWLDQFAPASTSSSADVTRGLRDGIERVLDLVDKTDLRGLQAVGLVLVLWAVVRLLGTIEAAFNDIWGARRARRFLRKLSDYMAIVFVAPILLVVGGGLWAALRQSEFDRFGIDLSRAMAWLLRFAPLVLSWLAFSFVYAALPNTRTRVRASLIGGFVAAVSWQVALALHVEFQLGVARYNAIYSTFAALPIFLIWVQLSWAIVLFGAEVAYAVQHEGEFRRIVGWREPTPAERARLVLRVAARLAQSFVEDSPPRTEGDLARELGVPSTPVDEVLQTLAAAGLAAASEEDQTRTWRIARDPARVALADVLDAALAGDGTESLAATGELDLVVDRQLGLLREERRGSAAN